MGQVLAMNLSAPFLVQFFGEQMATALAYCDYVFGNESEAAAFGEKQGWGADVSTIALKLAGEGEIVTDACSKTHNTGHASSLLISCMCVCVCVCRTDGNTFDVLFVKYF